MKRKLYSLIVLTSILILTTNIFIKSNELTNIITFSINLFIKNIFPSLFPMFIISYLLVEINIPKVIGSIFNKPFFFLFKTKSISSFVFFMSMITGFPSSAKYINDLIDKDLITEKDGNKILLFSFFSNPLLIVNTIGNIFYNDITIGFKILISHVMGAVITGIIFRGYNFSKEKDKISRKEVLKDMHHKINSTSITKTLLNAIENGLSVMINIFGIITFFLIVINMLFQKPDSLFEILTSGLIEMTTGLKYLSLSSFSINIKVSLSTFFISFGGLSVHFQIMSI